VSEAGSPARPRPLHGYARFFETLTPESLSRLPEHVTADVRFRDPFNNVVGEPALRRIFETMFAHVREPRFVVLASAREGDTGFLSWRFTGSVRALGPAPLQLLGVSEVRLAPDGRVREHIDHWDAASQVYARVPLLGWVLRRLGARLGT
jgi:steroid Delta-isomerase